MTSADTKPGRPARWFAPALFASFFLNVAALVFPFMHLKTVLMPAEVYTMFAGVKLLWQGGLYALAALVVAFSVVFPFAKLATITWVWLRGREHPERAVRLLHLVEALGKWSMLDIFLVALMIALTSSQWIISSKPAVGITFFLLAVILSMLCGAHLASRHGLSLRRRQDPAGGFLALLCVCMLTLMPVLEIKSFWLSRFELSLVSAMTGLAGAGAWSLSFAVLAFLVAAPMTQGAAQLLALRARRAGLDASRWEQVAAHAEHWSMLDVFTLALMIFLVEGREMVPTQVQPGCWILIVTVALQVAFGFLRRQAQD